MRSCSTAFGQLWISNALKKHSRRREGNVAASVISHFGQEGLDNRRFQQIIGTSRVLQSVLEQVELVGPTDSTVLILGETGTGKELIARAIHKVSSRCG